MSGTAPAGGTANPTLEHTPALGWINHPAITIETTEAGFNAAITQVRIAAGSPAFATATDKQKDFLATLTGSGYGRGRVLYVFRDGAGVCALMKVQLHPDHAEIMKIVSARPGGGAQLLAHALSLRPRLELIPLDGVIPYYRQRGFVSSRTRGCLSLDPRSPAGAAHWALQPDGRWRLYHVGAAPIGAAAGPAAPAPAAPGPAAPG